nr:unnamed protein product [Callosobruchus chinensis]
MAGDGRDPWDDPSLKGIQRYFNNKTQRGRAHATLGAATLFGGFLFYNHCLHDMVEGNEGSCGCECGTKREC